MISKHRNEFFSRYSDEKYAEFLALLRERSGGEVPFRCSETPCFISRATLSEMERLGRELTAQIVGNESYLLEATRAIPEAYRVPGCPPEPLFVQADFGFDEHLNPRLVEIQGFPSLYAFQLISAQTYRDAYELSSDLTPFLGDVTEESYLETVRDAIVGDCDPAETFLLELFPDTQKTLPDFRLTEKLFGVKTVCVTQVRQVGKRLFTPEGAPIRRLYNRTIADEMVRQNAAPAFDFREDLEVEWAGHPNWYFLLSKLSLPTLKHACVPETRRLSEFTAWPEDLEDWVLKPLFSFAGTGVVIGPTREQLAAVASPEQWLLQRRVRFIPTIETPEGPTKVELRVMYVHASDGLRGLTTLARMGRGALMGVDQNRDARWIGASAAFSPDT